MEIQDILALVQAVSDHSLTELELEDGDVKLSLKREEHSPAVINVAASGAGIPGTAVPNGMISGDASVSLQASAGNIASDQVVKSPLVGIFYSASSPDAEPFVKVGDTVKKGQVLGIIEAMKLMNEIESEYDGVVEAILVKNEDVVEYGQPLFRIR